MKQHSEIINKVEEDLNNGTLFYKHVDLDIVHPALRYGIFLKLNNFRKFTNNVGKFKIKIHLNIRYVLITKRLLFKIKM